MVRLRPPDLRASTHPADGRDRAQLLLVGAFTLAVLVVALALILNGAAETETLSTEATNAQDGQDAVRFQESVRRGVAGTIVRVNRDEYPSYGDLRGALNDNVTRWERLAGRGYATAGTGVSVGQIDPADVERGSRVTQTNASRDFTDANANGDWTLNNQTHPIDRTRDFEMTVSRAGLSPSCGNCFTVVADNGTETWRAEITNASGSIEVSVTSPAGSTTCSVTGHATVIDFSSGTVADGACTFPPFAEGLSGAYNISYTNAENANGSYRLVVREPVGNVDSTPSPYATGGGDPTLSRAVYSADVTFDYRMPQLTYRNTLTDVVPGDRDA